MRKETRKYLCAELRDYQQSVNELLRLRDRMEMLQYPAYRADCGSKKAAYIETRIAMLQEIVGAIDSLRREISEEDEKLLQLKFWKRNGTQSFSVLSPIELHMLGVGA